MRAAHRPLLTALLVMVAACGADDPTPGVAPEDMARDMRQLTDMRAPVDMPQRTDMSQPGDMRAPVDMAVAQDMARDLGPEDMGQPDMGAPLCALGEGSWCAPIAITSFPYTDTRDTRQAPPSHIDRYACAPQTDESGAEFYYRLVLTEATFLTARVNDVSGDAVDVDVHLLRDDGGTPSGASCLQRDNVAIGGMLEPGAYLLVLDTWVNGSGVALAGEYTLDVRRVPLTAGTCAMRQEEQEMFWSSCAAGIACDDRNGKRYLRLPAFGPVVKEAHLVTVDESFPNTWPTSARDQITRHYQLSQQATGYQMSRTEAWAPSGEGGSRWGQGSTGAAVPVLDEAWYVNMYWRQRPAKGTRMIIANPANGRAVVASAGYETGPGANTAIGGVAEEIHDHLGTTHRSELIMGFAQDQTLALGPISCGW